MNVRWLIKSSADRQRLDPFLAETAIV